MPKVLLTHDGELGDIRELLETLGAKFEECIGDPSEEQRETVWKVIVGTPRRVLALQVGAAGEKPTRIALLEGDSKTLVAMLRRSGVDLMVHRPVHPEALRLLVLHALYQGPEKRRHQRFTIGAPIRFRSGLTKKQGTLADLSLRGCRLVSPIESKAGSTLKIFFTSELGCSKSFAMKGKVIRSGPTEGMGPGMFATAIEFEVVTRDEAAYLKGVLAAHVSGPAMLEGAEAAKHTVTRAASQVPQVVANPAGQAEAEAPNERRTEQRHAIDRQIIALGVEATRVLIGRDISVGGMRVETNDTLSIGDEVRLALHVRARAEPLVVQARVEREDGPDGMLLGFHSLTDAAENYLRKMVNFLPILAARGGDEGSGVVVSEILERGEPRPADAADEANAA